MGAVDAEDTVDIKGDVTIEGGVYVLVVVLTRWVVLTI